MSLTFITNGLHRTAGTERVIVQLAKELPYPITIYVPGITDVAFEGHKDLNIISLNVGDFPTEGIMKKIYHRVKYFSALKNNIKNYDSVFAFSFDLNVLSIILSFTRDIKVIASEHIEYGYHKGLRNKIRKILYKKKNVKVVCLTETDKEKFLNDGINAYCIPNFIYPIETQYNPESKNILAIGRLEYQKNFALLIKAFAISKVYIDGWKLTIVGEGSELNILNRLIKEKSMQSFISIRNYTKQIEEYYNNAGLFSMTSRFEAFPMVLLEAMNHNLPVLLTDFPTGAREILGNDKEQIIPNNDAEIYAKHLNNICNNSALRIELSNRNSKTVQNYQVYKVIEKWNKII